MTAANLVALLEECESFVDRHSEKWYRSGQELLEKIRTEIALQKSPNCTWCGSPGDHYSGCAFEGQPRRSTEIKKVHVAECAHGRRLEMDCRDCENETPYGCGRMISTAQKSDSLA